MQSTDLGACEWFVWDLRRSNLIERGQLDQYVGEFLTQHAGAEPPALADFLVNKEILTQFQAERLLQGKTQGFVLGPFILLDALGSGSMGTVYKAQSKTDKGCYAVKVLPRRSMWNVRIARRKVRAFEQCKHPAVVPFVDVGTAGGMHYLAWPLVEGEPLDRVVQRDGRMDPSTAALLGAQTAEGLAGCHEQGLFHGLLKPSNLMILPDGDVRILDLGIGCLLAETEGESLVDTMSTANSVSSGLDCASPESIMDPTNLTPPGDQYSLGCVLYFCLTGQYPFPDGTAVEKMMAHQTKQPKPIRNINPEVPVELSAVVERLMAKSPEARFGSAAEAAEALRAFNKGVKAAPAKAPSRALPTREPVGQRAPLRTESPDDNTPPPAPRRELAPARAGSPAPRASVAQLPTRQSLLEQGAPPRSAPREPAASTLPTRQALQEPSAAPTSKTAPEPARATPRSQAVPAATQVKKAWEERFGPLGIAACALLACILAWLVSRSFF